MEMPGYLEIPLRLALLLGGLLLPGSMLLRALRLAVTVQQILLCKGVL